MGQDHAQAQTLANASQVCSLISASWRFKSPSSKDSRVFQSIQQLPRPAWQFSSLAFGGKLMGLPRSGCEVNQ